MKNIKNSKLKAKDALMEQVKEGKIKKNKHKKKSEDELAKVKDINLIQKTEGTINGNNIARKLKNKNKPTKPEENKKAIDDVSKIEKPKEKDLMKKKHKQNVQTELPSKEHTENELKRTAENKTKKLKKQKGNAKKNDKTILAPSTTRGIQQIEEPVTVATSESYAAGSKVLMKKQKKAQKRQLTKDQKFAEKQTRDPAIEEATVFVGNVPINIKRSQIIRLFKDFAPVSSIRLRTAGGKVFFRHKHRKLAGCLNAYVVLKDKETAEKALSLNGTELKGNHLRVTLSLKKLQNHEKEDAKRTVFVGNLKYSCTEKVLREIFLSCGEIDYIRCIRDGDKGCKGIAYVCFKTPDSVGLALELNGTIVDERPINVERYSVKKLGAKEAREALAQRTENKRLDENKSKKDKTANEKQIHSKTDYVITKKKSEFRGVKVDSIKKKQKSKKKKPNNEMLKLAKKIAFKSAT